MHYLFHLTSRPHSHCELRLTHFFVFFEDDQPLVVQFAAKSAETLAKASTYLVGYVLVKESTARYLGGGIYKSCSFFRLDAYPVP